MASPSKERLDKLLVDLGHCDTRSQAQGLILAGKVRVNGEKADKPGTMLQADKAVIELEASLPYVSRGGLKLEKALDVFGISPEGRVCMDIGASTGGFTDCLLQRGAVKVYAIDVGYGQLDWKLRKDPRVVTLEKTNIRHVTPEQIPEAPTLSVTDVSFISLKKVLPAITALMRPETQSDPLDVVALLKPQFEYKDYVHDSGFKGVVKGIEQHRTIVSGLLGDLTSLMHGWQLVQMDFSPITGPKGNMEFLLHYQKNGPAAGASPESLAETTITKGYESLGAGPGKSP